MPNQDVAEDGPLGNLTGAVSHRPASPAEPSAGPRISVVVNTLNEEKNLPYALRSVRQWADEIVVVDMQSKDRTIEIARDFGARVYAHRREGCVEPARAYAVSQARGPWILLLDADEIVPRPLSLRLREIAASNEADVALLPKVNYLLGAPLAHTGWGPGQYLHPLFFKLGFVEMSGKIHNFAAVSRSARVLRLRHDGDNAIIHFNYLDCSHFLEKLNRYTTVEAEQAAARGARPSAARAIYLAGRELARLYVRHGGYRDGWRGFYLSCFMASYRIAAQAKLQEMHSCGDRATVEEGYRLVAEKALSEYDQWPTWAPGSKPGNAERTDPRCPHT